MSRYINPYTDFGFKKLFGKEANKDLLIDFLNAVLPEENRVADVEFNDPDLLPDNIGKRQTIFDVSCTDSNGKPLTVEMQKMKPGCSGDSVLFFMSDLVLRQVSKGSWNFEKNPLFHVAVFDFLYNKESERQKLYQHVMLRDEDHKVSLKSPQFILLQMPLFSLQESELVTHRDKWLYFLKNLESLDEIPQILREPIFEKAFETAEYSQMSPQMQKEYDASQKAYLDNENV